MRLVVRVSTLLLLVPRLVHADVDVSFADLAAGQAAIVDDPVYFDRMQPMEMEAKTGQPLTTTALADQRAECRRRYQAAVREFSEAEKTAIRGLVTRIDPLVRANYPCFAQTPWNFLKVANNIEAGFPHTRGKHIVFAERVCRGIAADQLVPGSKRLPLRAMELLLHEQMHVFQRAHAEQFDSLYSGQWGFIRAKSITACPWIVEHQLLNPDAIDCLWVFPIPESDGTKYIWPLCSLSDKPGPQRMQRDFSMLAFDLSREGDRFRVPLTADGRPQYSNLLSVGAYRKVFPLSSNIYHPHEASADLFAQLVIFDSHRAQRMSPSQQAENEKTFGPLRKWFRENLSYPLP
jgi:hypothetical protein